MDGFSWLGDSTAPHSVGDRLVFPAVGDRPDQSVSASGLDLPHCRYTVSPDDRVADVAAILFPGLTAVEPLVPPPGGVVQLPPWSCAWLTQVLAGGAVQGHLGAAPWLGSRGTTRWLAEALVGGADRAGVVALANSYVGVSLGDAKFEEVTQGRAGNKGYSACGDLINFVLWRLGVRDPDVVNRAEPSAGLVWHVQQNISRPIAGAKKYGGWVQAAKGLTPKPGDLVLIGHYPDEMEHVFVHTGASGSKWSSADYGQVELGSGKPSSKRVVREVAFPKLGSRTLVGWIDVDKLPRAAAANLPGGQSSSLKDDVTVGAVILGALAVAKWVI